MSVAVAFEVRPEDSRISVEEMYDASEDMMAFARVLRTLEAEPMSEIGCWESPWTCYCEACDEARNKL